MSARDEQEQRMELLEILVRRHYVLYRNNPIFHATIDTMVNVIPRLVDLSAESAAREEQMRQQLARQMASERVVLKKELRDELGLS